MEIRGARTWCERCQAPEVWHDNLPTVELYLEALPAWRTTGMDRLLEGFDRAEVRALMALRGIAEQDQPGTWAALAEMEQETRTIRSELTQPRP